ncbi:hypothetical protein CFP56_035427 [Quercus suber]|uniref:Uncharacterized protein n=1 Tax=Quercus suber TaxID=58331 RepID=A0AAW0J9Q8_QUESU
MELARRHGGFESDSDQISGIDHTEQIPLEVAGGDGATSWSRGSLGSLGSTLLLLRIIIGHWRNVVISGYGQGMHWVLRLRLGRQFLSWLEDGPGPLDGLLIPSALLSLCILLF